MPGNRPNSTSGRPMVTPSSATMVWQASASSSPPPSASPWTSAIVRTSPPSKQLFAAAGLDQAAEQFEVAAEVEGVGIGRQHHVAQLARAALGVTQGDGGQVAPHVVHQRGAEARPDAGGGVRVHVQPVLGAAG